MSTRKRRRFTPSAYLFLLAIASAGVACGTLLGLDDYVSVHDDQGGAGSLNGGGSGGQPTVLVPPALCKAAIPLATY